jgi:hypothetical protein
MVATEKRHVGNGADEPERVEAGVVDELKGVLTASERDRSGELRGRPRTMAAKEGVAIIESSRREVYRLRSGQRKAGPGRLDATLAVVSSFVER